MTEEVTQSFCFDQTVRSARPEAKLTSEFSYLELIAPQYLPHPGFPRGHGLTQMKAMLFFDLLVSLCHEKHEGVLPHRLFLVLNREP